MNTAGCSGQCPSTSHRLCVTRVVLKIPIRSVSKCSFKDVGCLQSGNSLICGRRVASGPRNCDVPRLRAQCLTPLCTAEALEGSNAVLTASRATFAEAYFSGEFDPPTRLTTKGRVVAIGDIHGDLPKAIRALEVAGVLSEYNGRPLWTGGDTVVVQLGDVLDRGDCEIGVILLLRELNRQARKEHGAVLMLNGNHESLNVCGDFRYVTAGAFLESAAASGLRGDSLQLWDNQLRARMRLYSPGGPMAVELAKNPTVLIVNDTVFAHGGLLPSHVSYGLSRINGEVAAWMRGDRLPDGSLASPPYLAMGDSSSVMWNRSFGKERWATPFDRQNVCATLKRTLEAVGAKRMVVGHTPQMCGANCECDGQVWRVDIGMSSGVLDAAPQVLFIDQLPDDDSLIRVATDSSCCGPFEEGFHMQTPN